MNDKNEKFKDRLQAFCLEIINLVNKLPKTLENQIFARQVIRSSSSIGANYAEAAYAHTRADFIHCINISRKEANETLYWLELIAKANLKYQDGIKSIIEESRSILKMFIASVKTARLKKDSNTTLNGQ